MLFYISTSSISRGKIFRLMITGATTQPHHKSTARASWPWSIEFFPVRSRVVAGDWPVIDQSLPVAWGGNGPVLQRQINLRPAVAPLFTTAKNRERWKACRTQDKNAFDLTGHGPSHPPWRQTDFIATLRQCSLPIIKAVGALSEDTPPVGLTNFMRRFLARKYHRPWLCWVIFHCSESFFVILSTRNPSKHETTSWKPLHVKTQPQRPCLLLRSKANLQSFLDSW